MFFEGGGYKSRAGCHGARTVGIFRNGAVVSMLFRTLCVTQWPYLWLLKSFHTGTVQAPWKTALDL